MSTSDEEVLNCDVINQSELPLTLKVQTTQLFAVSILKRRRSQTPRLARNIYTHTDFRIRGRFSISFGN
jgi:hypothetical protein